MDVPPAELAAEVAYQIGALEVFARAAGTRVAYVKPHGALYNRVVHDEEQAARGRRRACSWRTPRCPCSGCPARACWSWPRRPGLPAVPEAFADRAYTDAGHARAARPGRARWSPTRRRSWRARWAWPGPARSTALLGARIAVRARSLCVHGDTPGAVELARRVRERLEAAGVRVEAFA